VKDYTDWDLEDSYGNSDLSAAILMKNASLTLALLKKGASTQIKPRYKNEYEDRPIDLKIFIKEKL
jgi:hypothetical protein